VTDARRVTVELRDSTATRRQMQLDPRDIISATFTQRDPLAGSGPGAWAVTMRADSDGARLLAQPGWGIVASLRGALFLSGSTENPQTTQTATDPAGTVTIGGLEDTALLSDVLCWPSPSTTDLAVQNGSTSQPGYDVRTGQASTVMRAYVQANVVGAPAARRPSGALHTRISLEADPLLGGTVTGSGRWQTLAEMLNTLGKAGGLSYRVVWVQDGVLRFRLVQPRDLSKTVRLYVQDPSTGRGGAVSQLAYGYAAPAATMAIIGGAGEDTARLYASATTADSRAAQSLWHRYRERFVDDSSADPVELAQNAAAALADDGKTVTSVAVELADAAVAATMQDQPGVKLFGRDYGVGDTVSVLIRPNATAPAGEIAQTLTEATLTMDQQGYRVTATVGAPAAVPPGGDPLLGLVVRTIRTTQANARRVSALERRR
jgi:hypothetical protein